MQAAASEKGCMCSCRGERTHASRRGCSSSECDDGRHDIAPAEMPGRCKANRMGEQAEKRKHRVRSTTEYCGVLRSTAEYCGVLRSTAEYCGVLRSTAEYCGVLRSTHVRAFPGASGAGQHQHSTSGGWIGSQADAGVHLVIEPRARDGVLQAADCGQSQNRCNTPARHLSPRGSISLRRAELGMCRKACSAEASASGGQRTNQP